MYNFYTGMAYVDNWSVPSPVSILFWLTVQGYNGSGHNRFIGSGDDFEARFITATEDYRADIYDVNGEILPSSPAGTGIRIHLAFTGEINGTVKSYLNGVLDVTSGTVTGSPTSPASLGVGGRYGNTSVANGDMEDIRIYNRELSAREIQTIYTINGPDLNYDGLINRWGVVSKGNGDDIGTDYIFDSSPSRQHLQKLSNDVYYRGGFITPRRRV